MGQSQYEKDRNRFTLSERLIVELFLLSYLFIFFLGNAESILPYVWLAISIIGGVISYFLFYTRDYSVGYGTGLALVLTVPLLLFSVPLMNILIFFVYVLWRVQANFNGSRIDGWPFFTVNTIVFVFMYFMARLVYAHNNPEELMQQQIILYLISSFLYFFIRMVTIIVNSRQLRNFKVSEASRIFGYIVGLGLLSFVFVLFALDPIRRGIIGVLGFVFGGVLSLFGRALDPILEMLNAGYTRFLEEKEEEDVIFVDFELQDELTTYGNTSSIFEYTAYGLALVFLIILTVVLLRKKGKKRDVEKMGTYTFTFRGKKEKTEEQRQLLYDYSSARDEVRKTFEQFEKEAQEYKLSRMHGETVKEWFARMGWKQHDLILSIYNDVRYGSRTPSEQEHSTFIQEIEQIKKTFFNKEV